MRRQYNPPPTYGGSRFIRATHGVRGLEDNELASQADRRGVGPWDTRHTSSRDSRRGIPDREELLPDFEYYGNVLSDGSDVHNSDSYTGQIVESGESRDQRRMADEEYRDSPAPVDRFGHDYNMSSFSSPYTFGVDSERDVPDEDDWNDRNDGSSRGCTNGMCDERDERVGRTENAGRMENVSGGARTRRPVRRGAMLRSDRPIRGRRERQASARPDDSDSCEVGSVLCAEQKPHPLLNFSVEDGDLLLLVILALLAGEDGCADLVATLALLLMIR